MPRHLTTDDSLNLVSRAELGAPSGVAALDADGKVPAAQLPASSSGSVTSVNGQFGNVLLTVDGLGAVPVTSVGQVSGVAPLDSAGLLPLANLPSGAVQSVNGHDGPTATLTATDVGALTQTAADGRYVPLTQKGAASGVASLDGSGKVPATQLPAAANAVTSVNSRTGAVVLTSADVDAVPTAQKGAASGVATLDSGALIPAAQIPGLPASQISSGAFVAARIPDLSATYLTTAQKGAASGVASLDSSSLLPVAQVPNLPASKVNSGTLAVAQIPGLSSLYVPVATSNADNQFGPGDHGLLAWSAPVDSADTSATPSSGAIRLAKIVLRRPATISTLWVSLLTGGSGMVAGQCFLGLYTVGGTRVGATADQATAWASAGAKSSALTTPYSAAAGEYYVAILGNAATTMPTFNAASNSTPISINNINLPNATLRFANGPSGQTALPASITMSTNSANSAAYWVAAS